MRIQLRSLLMLVAVFAFCSLMIRRYLEQPVVIEFANGYFILVDEKPLPIGELEIRLLQLKKQKTQTILPFQVEFHSTNATRYDYRQRVAEEVYSLASGEMNLDGLVAIDQLNFGKQLDRLRKKHAPASQR